MRWLAVALLVATPAFAGLRAGAAKRVITPDLKKFSPVYMAGFGQNRVATAIHDDLFVRCMAMHDGKTAPVVLCGVDVIGLFSEDVQRIRKLVGADVTVAALHDHEAPDTMGLWGPAAGQSGINEDYNTFVIEQAAAAAKEALANLQPAQITLAKAHPAELDTYIDDTRPPVVHDAEIIVLLAKATNGGKTIGVLLNWANHPESLGGHNTQITADYSASLYIELERQFGGTAVFLNGAVGGMQSPLGAKMAQKDETFERADYLGRRVAQIAAEALRSAKPVNVDGIRHSEVAIAIPVTNQGFQQAAQAGVFKGRKPMSEGKNHTTAGYLRISNGKTAVLEVALIPGELYPELSVGGVEKYSGADFPDAPVEPAIKTRMTAPYRMLIGLANDEIGYIIPKLEWDEKAPWLNGAKKHWYGEVNSVGPEAAPVVTDAIIRLMSQP